MIPDIFWAPFSVLYLIFSVKLLPILIVDPLKEKEFENEVKKNMSPG